jgi:uncharacterized protein YndB with AHSA1/START domain
MSSNPRTAQATLPNDRAVVVTRQFSAPRALVYDAFTRPDLVQRWLLGPPGWTMPVCEMDVRVGGRFRWRWRADEDGTEFGFEGEYLEVKAPARIRNTESFDPGTVGGAMGEAIVTTEFVDRDGATLMTITIEYPTKEIRDEALATGMTNGMEMGYQRLDEMLALQDAG